PFLTRAEIAALNDETLNNSTKRRCIECTSRREIKKIPDPLGGDLRHHRDVDWPKFSFQRDTLASHLLNCSAIERFRWRSTQVSRTSIRFLWRFNRAISLRHRCRNASEKKNDHEK